MEVHAHTLTEKKRFKHYLWEFLMLFLAVFCGFLAENIRENKVEKARAKQYILSFYEDLKTDTAGFSGIIAYDEQKAAALNGMFHCYDTLLKNWKATSCLVPLVKNSSFNRAVNFTESTMQQLKNAGGFRLLDKEDRDSIIAYDNAIRGYKDYESTVFQESQNNVRNTFDMLKDFKANKFLYPAVAGSDSSHAEMPLLLTDNKVLLNKYFNDLFRYRMVTNTQRRVIKEFNERVTGLIKYYKNKYHLN